MKFTSGLVLGKFAPLHKGHELLIKRSLDENLLTYVMIYDCPEVTQIPLAQRVSWIKKMFPQVRVIEAWNGNNTVSNDPKIMKEHEQYILKLLGDIKIDNFYSSEFYGEHVSKALGAVDCRIDPGRTRTIVPISGTTLRSQPRFWKKYLSPIVYRSLRPRVLILGAPSTGKTTLCKSLAKTYRVKWVPEYGRAYWARFNKGRRLTMQQLETIARTHLNIMRNTWKETNDRVMFVDTDASTTRNFAKYYHGCSSIALDFYTSMSIDEYDLTFVCDTDIPYDDTDDRSGEGSRELFQRQILGDLEARKIPFTVVSGTVTERVTQVEKLLRSKML